MTDNRTTFPSVDNTGADVECSFDLRATVRRILFEASDPLIRLILLLKNGQRQLTEDEVAKLLNIRARVDEILQTQGKRAA